MKHKTIPLVIALFAALNGFSQNGYDIKINLKNCKDTVAYLAKYYWDKSYLVDTCKKVKNGTIHFKGKEDLEKGVYIVVSQAKVKYFDFFVTDAQKFSFNSDLNDVEKFLKCTGSKENEDFIAYKMFMIGKNGEFDALRKETKGKSKSDSAKFMGEKVKGLEASVRKFEKDYIAQNAGKFAGSFIALQKENWPEEIPAQKNAADSNNYRYYYYKAHYWDNVDFTNSNILRTPFLAGRVKKYLEQTVIQLPDSVSKEVDMIIDKCPPGSEIYKFFLSKFTFDFETNKVMGFDRVFVHLIDRYVRTGKAKDIYDETVTQKIIERGNILKPLLIGNKAPDLLMIDTIDAKAINKLGFDTAKSSESLTNLYNRHYQKFTDMYKTLYDVKAKYTILVFWDVDCSHCQIEIPKLLETWHDLRKTYDVKVMSVYTQHDFNKWRKYLIEKKLDFINVYDPVHINNIKVKYDIISTPVIYLLDKDKVIQAKSIPEKELEGLIKYLEEREKKK